MLSGMRDHPHQAGGSEGLSAGLIRAALSSAGSLAKVWLRMSGNRMVASPCTYGAGCTVSKFGRVHLQTPFSRQ